MDRGAWQGTIHGVARVGHDLMTDRFFSITLLQLLIFPESSGWKAMG